MEKQKQVEVQEKNDEKKRIEELEREIKKMQKELKEFKEESNRTYQQFEEKVNELKGKKGVDDLKTQIDSVLKKIEKMNGAWSVGGKIWRAFILLLNLSWMSAGFSLLLLQTEIENLLDIQIHLENTYMYIYIPVALLLILVTIWAMVKPSARKDYLKIAEIMEIHTKEVVSERMVRPCLEQLDFDISEDKSKYGWYFMVVIGAIILPIGEINSILILIKPVLLMELLLCFHIIWNRPNRLKKQAKQVLKNRLWALVEEN